jgi:hypothetical protein
MISAGLLALTALAGMGKGSGDMIGCVFIE